ncbi:MAG: hypothetical protein U0P45_07470 [Acidimicrobiales bacterium]
MLIDPGHHLGDAWFHVAAVEGGELAHCFYLRCPEGVDRHTAWEVAHATSWDLRAWELHGTVLAARRDGRCLATGSVLGLPTGGHLAAWTIGWNDVRPEVAIAPVADLGRWDPARAEVVAAPGVGVTGARDPILGARPITHWRDPQLVLDGDGAPMALVCAGPRVAVLQPTATGWAHTGHLDVAPVASELECPQLHEVDGRWFLLFSTWSPLLAPDVRAAAPAGTYGGTWAMAGPGPQGPFRLADPSPLVGPEAGPAPYACQLVRFGGRHHLLGTRWRKTADPGSEPDAVSDPIEVVRQGDGLVAAPSVAAPHA